MLSIHTRIVTYLVHDRFAPRRQPGASFFHALLATALFRCWHLLVFFAAWSTLITILNRQGHKLFFQPTLLTVIGTVIGFVISYRTTSSFERYNEGRRLWSQIILASRTFARTVWFHIPDPPASENVSAADMKARAMIEKKSVINLLEAFSVAIKHYLRGEDGIYYEDLYYLVKFLPAYALPAGMPSHTDLGRPQFSPTSGTFSLEQSSPPISGTGPGSSAARRGLPPPLALATRNVLYQRTPAASAPELPLPATVTTPRKAAFFEPLTVPLRPRSSIRVPSQGDQVTYSQQDESQLMPAYMPPKYHLFDLFPFSLLVRWLTKRGKELKGKKAARIRARTQKTISHNLPLEISLYLSSYIASLQHRKATDVPTTNSLLSSLNQLVDSLTGLERILTTPIPFSYSIHLWVVTIIYCFALPFQIWTALNWLTIPATTIASFIFFGFLTAGEEIENPFGYDKNDLNLDHFTHNIIRTELRAITSTAAPDPTNWAFSPENNLLFASNAHEDERVSPEEWLRRGYPEMQRQLSRI
ncbi:UPF0187-domain-containing protein [Pluteus cervinus]|uniref:UPF0187-domain-containing protein n=1 Tax=Pluteus cervinus TaxID=181527 RepID=A0ACD3ARY1_9AGAR|nr:UPF0187-domain-containing protein [Pluteus cervinus]